MNPLGGVLVAFLQNSALAQITPDSTLPSNSRVEKQGDIRIISGGTQAKSNLFHSFQEFSVPTNTTAYFNNAGDIQNIITRVTGGSISNIDGVIRANGTASLFFINPSGIIFGPNAQLNIGGSFLASTASSLKFADGFEFNAIAPKTIPLLTVNLPVGLQFGNNPGKIVNLSQARNNDDQIVGLQVPNGKSLVLVGGDINLDGGKLTAAGGRIELGGSSASGTVGFILDNSNLSLNFPDAVPRSNVSLTDGAEASVVSDGGGDIIVNARNLDVLGGSNISAGIGRGLGSVRSQAGNITINAKEAIAIVGDNSRIRNNLNPNGTGNSGNINITTGSLSVIDGARLQSSSRGKGNAGSVIINARNTVEFSGTSSDRTK